MGPSPLSVKGACSSLKIYTEGYGQGSSRETGVESQKNDLIKRRGLKMMSGSIMRRADLFENILLPH